MKIFRRTLLAFGLWLSSAILCDAATLVWTNTSSSTWSTAANWNPNQVPTASDTVIITNSGVTVTLTASSAAGAITLGASADCGPSTILSMNGQTLSVGGLFAIGTCGQYTLDSGTLAGGAGTSVSGAMAWNAGDLAGTLTLNADAVLTISTANNHDMENVTLTNNGAVTWVSGTIRGGGNPGTFFYNNGLWDCQSDQAFNDPFGGVGIVFNNLGTFRKSGGAGGNNFTLFAGGAAFNQLAGKIDVQSGTTGLALVFQGGGTLRGGFITTNLNGITVLSSGNFNVNGTVTGTNTVEDAGNLTGNNVINGNLTWAGGVWDGASVTVTPNSGVLMNSTGNLDMENASVTNNGTVTWVSGTIRVGGNPGTFIYNSGVWDAQSDQQFQDPFGGAGGVFNNFGTFQKSGGTLSPGTVLQGGVLYNQTSGTLDAIVGSLILQGSGNFTGGSVTAVGSGETVLSLGSYNLNGVLLVSNIVEGAGNLVGNNVINGNLKWVSGTWDNAGVTITSGATVLAEGGTGDLDMENTSVTNNGTFAWATGTLRGGNNPGTFIYNNGVWDAQSDQQFQDPFGGNGVVFNNSGTFQKSGGTLSPGTVLTGGVLYNQTSGTLDAIVGSVILQGSGNFTGGSVTAVGTGETVLSIGSFNLNGVLLVSNIVEDAGNLVGNNVINGNLTWASGVWNGAGVTITPGATVLAEGGTGDLDMENTSVTNNGTFAWATGTLRGGNNPGTFIYNNGLWDAQSDQQFQDPFGGNGVVFNNSGTFQKSGGTLSPGTVLTGGVLYNQTSGTLDAIVGSVILQGSGNFTGGSVTAVGTGETVLSIGSFNLNGVLLVSNIVEDAGNLVGNNVINGNLTWASGVWNGAGVTITPGATVLAEGGTGDLDMENTSVTNNGTFAWATGTLRGGNNPGTFIYNNGLWDAQSDQQFQDPFGGNGVVFNDSGTFQKTGGAGGNNFTLFGGGVVFNKLAGKIDVQNGTNGLALVLQGGGTFSGGFVTPETNGETVFSQGNFTLNGTITSTNTFENAGILVGNNVIIGALQWAGGNWDGAKVTIAPSSTVYMIGAGNLDMENTSVTNNGTVAWVTGTLRGGNNPGTLIYNNGLWDAQSDQQFQNPFGGNGIIFNNNSGGTFNKSTTAGTTLLALNTFTNSGTIKALTGTISLNTGALEQNHGTITFGLASPTVFGHVSTPTPLALNGTLALQLLGGFMPALGNSWTPLTSTADSSKFENLNLTTLPAGDAWQVAYNPASVTLTVVAAGAQPGLITGTVKDAPTHGVAGISVFAFSDQNPTFDYTTTTDVNGNYSLNVTNGNITVGLANLPASGYNPVADQVAAVSGLHETQVVNFVIQAIGATSPTAVTEAATGVTPTTATLNGAVTPNGEAVSVYFLYGAGSLNQSTPTNTISTGLTTIQLQDMPVAGLSPATQYEFEIVAANSIGSSTGAVMQFTTPGLAPVVVTEAATDIGPTNATLNGTINPGGLATTFYFEYGLTTNYGTFTPTNGLAAGLATVGVTNAISNLQPATVYHFQLVGSNALGVIPGGDLTFTNLPAAPTVVTLAATALDASDATLNGSVNPNGLATSWYFEWGTDMTYGNFTPTNNLSPTNIVEAVASALSGLSSDTIYHFQLVAANSLGTNFGGDQSFSTAEIGATVTCPGTIITNTTPGQCSQVVMFAATASGNPTPTVSYTFGGVPITSPFSFPVGTNIVTATASNPAGQNSCQFAVVVIDSTPPIAGANQLGTFENKAASVDVAKVLLRDTSQSGSPLSIIGVTTSTPGGAAVTLGAGKITYTPAANFIGADTLTYTLSDGCGTTQGTIAVTVLSTNLPANNEVSISVGPTSRTVVFAGVPGASYVVQSAPAMNGPWTDLSGVMQAAANGLIQYTDATFPVPPTRFYRTRYVSGP